MNCHFKTQLLCAMSLSSLLTGCAATTLAGSTSSKDMAAGVAGAMTPIGSVLGLNRYYPLQRTFTWTYRVIQTGSAGTKVVQDVTRIDSLADANGTKTATYTGTRTEEGIVTSVETGTVTETYSALTIVGNGGSEIISLPLQAGKDWSSGSLSAHCYALDSLVVLGKTYKEVLAITYTKDKEVKAVRWLAPGYGIIKQVAKITQSGEALTLTSELVSAQLSLVTSVSLTPASLTISRGATASVNALAAFDDGSISREVDLSVLPQGFATISAGGLITAGQATGSVTITARSQRDATMVATASLTVN